MDWTEVNLPYGPSEELVDGHFMHREDTFTGRGLGKPGTLIRMEDGNEYLIGHINEVVGVCDDCVAFGNQEIVLAYRVVWTPEEPS